MNNKNKKIGISTIVYNITAWCISITILFPLFWMLYSSVKDNVEFMNDTLALPKEILLGNYLQAMQVGGLTTAFTNSAFYAIINIILVVVFSLITAYFIARYDFKGRTVIRLFYMVGMLIPLYALLVPVFIQYKFLDLLNNRFALIITYYGMSVPLAIFLEESFISGIPNDIDEASVIDGCNMLQRLFLVIFPLCKPIIATVCILTMLNTWNEFAFAVILTPDESLRTVSIALRYFATGQDIQYTYLLAALSCTSLPIIICYILFSKEIIKGMTAGAVKG